MLRNTGRLVVAFAVWVLVAGPVSAEKLLLWNRFGSEEEVASGTYYYGTQWGPGFQQTSYIYDPWEEAQIEPAIFGDGLFVNHDTSEGWAGDGANFFAVDLWEAGVSSSQGMIEHWFEYRYDCGVSNHAYFLRTAPELTDHFDVKPPFENLRLMTGWIGWSGYSDRKRFQAILHAPVGDPVQAMTAADSAGPGGHLAFSEGTQQHFAMVWDVDGIDGTDDTLRLYVNGNLEGATTDTWDESYALEQYLYVGTHPNVDPWDHFYNAVKGVTDNLKIWDYAALDAIEERFDEDYVPEPGRLLLGLGAAAVLSSGRRRVR